MDALIISNVLFQSEDKFGVVDEAKRILKKDGKVLFIEGIPSFNNLSSKFKHYISKEEATDIFTKRGFKFLEKITTDKYYYAIIFIHE